MEVGEGQSTRSVLDLNQGVWRQAGRQALRGAANGLFIRDGGGDVARDEHAGPGSGGGLWLAGWLAGSCGGRQVTGKK